MNRHNLSTPIAYGRRSVLYVIGHDSILKLYEAAFPEKEIQAEFEKTRLIAEHTSLPIARPSEVVRHENRHGIFFERVSGVSAMDLMMKKVWQVPLIVKKLAAIHRRIHEEKVPLISQEEFLLPFLMSSDRLSDEELRQVSQAFSRLHTNAPKLCHGDFHQGNVLLTKDSFFVLDWMDAFSGNPLLDVALTAVNAATSSTPPHVPKIFSILYESMSRTVRLDRWILHEYGVSEKEPAVRDALLVAAAIHVVRCKEKSWGKQKLYLMKLLHD